MDTQENDIVLVAEKSGLEKTKVEILVSSFSEYFAEAKQIVSESGDIVVTDEKDSQGMQNARIARLKLRKIRVEAEKERVRLKESSRREGLAIDGVNNVLKALIVPVEVHLKLQEEFAEIKEKERIESRLNDRKDLLSKYVSDSSIYNLRDMGDEDFERLLEDSKMIYNSRIEAEKKAKVERIAKEKAEQEKQEKIRLENIKLKKKIEAQKAKEAIERKKQDDALKAEHEKREAIEAKIREEKELEAKKKAKELAKIEAERKLKEEKEKKRLLAPDKKKLTDFANSIDELSSEYPAVSNGKAGEIVQKSREMLEKVSLFIREEAKNI